MGSSLGSTSLTLPDCFHLFGSFLRLSILLDRQKLESYRVSTLRLDFQESTNEMERVPLNPGDSLQVEVWISHKHEKAGPILRAVRKKTLFYETIILTDIPLLLSERV